MKPSLLLFLFLVLNTVLFAQQSQKINDNLSVIRISENAYIHTGMLETRQFGRVGCNGLVYIQNREAVVMDTPPDSAQSEALLQWIEERFPGTKLKAVIVNHFHGDCLTGLPVFHRKGIPSYASRLTQTLAARDSVPVPQHAFDTHLELTAGGEKLVSRYFGEAHTKDNIVTWIPSARILFGGCMVKSLGSAKGNLADANETEWSRTIGKIKAAYGNAIVVVPGHGDAGSTELLDYTIRLFQKKEQQ